MAKKQSKRKLTSKQAALISWLAVLIYAIITIILGIYLKLTGDKFLLSFVGGSFFVFILFYFIILDVPAKKLDERRKEIEIKNIQRLSSTNFTQVYFYPQDTGGTIDIMMTILKNEECNFYAKLIENNCIHLIAKDKYNEEVFNEKIDNHLFFNCNFKIQE